MSETVPPGEVPGTSTPWRQVHQVGAAAGASAGAGEGGQAGAAAGAQAGAEAAKPFADAAQDAKGEAEEAARQAARSRSDAVDAADVSKQQSDASAAEAARARQSAGDASFFANRAEVAAFAAATRGTVYETVAAGLAASAEEDTFNVQGEGELYATTYRKKNGEAVFVNRIASLYAYEQIPAKLADLPGYALGIVRGMLTYGGLTSNLREWQLPGWKVEYLLDGTIRMKSEKGGALELTPDQQFNLPGLSSMSVLSAERIASLGNRRYGEWGAWFTDGSYQFGRWRHYADGRIVGPLGDALRPDGKGGYSLPGTTEEAQKAARVVTIDTIPGWKLAVRLGPFVLAGIPENSNQLVGFARDFTPEVTALDARVTALEDRPDPSSNPYPSPVMRVGPETPAVYGAEGAFRNFSSGTITEATYVRSYEFTDDCWGLRVVTTNRRLQGSGGEMDVEAAFTDRLAIEYDGRIYPVVFFGGKREVRVGKEEEYVSDPVPMMFKAGTRAKIITYRSCETLGERWVLGFSAITELGEGWIEGITLDQPTSSLALQAGNIVGPSLILGSKQVNRPTVALIGSSTPEGNGDVPEADGGYQRGCWSRALWMAGYAFDRLAAGGDRSLNFITRNQMRRDNIIRSGVTHVIYANLSNDVSSGATYEQAMDRLKQAVDILGGLGLKVILATYSPVTSWDTAGNPGITPWTTIAGQVPNSNNATRLQVNAAIRSYSHPAVVGVVDDAAFCEDPANPWAWRVDLGQATNDGTHRNPMMHRASANYYVPFLTNIISGE